ncbi:MAG: putative ABC transporter permease [Eubacterium sp.]
MYKICTYFFVFMFFSFCGWAVETLLYILRDKKFVKRGFLFGPLCPIYGTGALICHLVLYKNVDNIFLIFLYGTLLCGALEYVTHFLMEKIFHAMWWDYSNRRFNIHGRVYLNGLLIFGAGCVLIVKLFLPGVLKLVGLMNENVLYIICFILYSFLLLDIATTVADLKGSVAILKKLLDSGLSAGQHGIDVTDKKLSEFAENIKETEFVSDIINGVKSEKSVISRIKRRYPDFSLKKYKPILDIILDKPQEDKGRKDIKLYGSCEETDANKNKTDSV